MIDSHFIFWLLPYPYGSRGRTYSAYSRPPSDKRSGAYSRWGVAPAYSRPPTDKRSGAYQKLPPARAELAGAGEKSLKSLIGAPCPEAFNI